MHAPKFGAIDAKSDESVHGFSVATECYNFDFSSGALRDGYGISASDVVPSEALRYWVYRAYSEDAGGYVDQYVFQIANGRLKYYNKSEQKTKYVSTVVLNPASVINYRLDSKDVLLISCEGKGLLVWDGLSLKEYREAPKITSMALHYERLFVTSSVDPTKLFFSDDLNPTNWKVSSDAGGFIEFLDERGELKKVVSFGNYLYLFREHGISRVTAYADQGEFSAVNLYVPAGRIYEQSIAVCGSVIIFAASDGLYAFDGYECTRIAKNLGGMIDGKYAVASAYHNGKYYLSCRIDFDDGCAVGCESGEYAANALFVYDLAHGEYSISRGLDISYLGSCTYDGADMLVAVDGSGAGVIERSGKRFDVPLEKKWTGALDDFGSPDRTKTLRELYIDSSVECNVLLENGKHTKTVKIKPGDRRVRVNMSTKKLRIAVATDKYGCNIRIPTVVYS